MDVSKFIRGRAFMYHKEKINSIMSINDYNISMLKLNLLRTTFFIRIENGLDDTCILQSIIDNGYLTVDEILAEKNTIRVVSEDISPFYSNIINAVTKKAIEDTLVRNVLMDYFNDIYCRGNINNPTNTTLLKSDIKKFYSGMLNKDKACWIAYLTLYFAADDDFNTIIRTRDVCVNQELINPFYNVKQCTLLETISDFLDYDMVKNIGFTDRFVCRRRDELFSYLCQQERINPSSFSDEEKDAAICAASVGVCSVDFFERKKYSSLVEKGLFQPANIGLGDEMSIQILGPLNKVGISSATMIASQMLKADYGEIHCFRNIIGAILSIKESKPFVKNAILEYLLDVLSDSYFSLNKDKYSYEQIIRQLSYSDTDCRIVFEKVAASIQFYVIANHLNNMIDSSIVYGNYDDIKSSIQRNVSVKYTNVNKSKKISKVLKQATKKKLSDVNTALNEQTIKTSKLESENEKLKEELMKLKKQINRDERKNQTINDLKEQIGILNDENEVLSERLNKLREKNTEVNEEENTETELVISDEFFTQKRFVIIGGRYEINRKLEELMPKTKFVYEPTENVNVRNFDGVIFFTDYVSHKTYSRFIHQCRIHNSPILYLKGSNLDKLKKEIYFFIND